MVSFLVTTGGQYMKQALLLLVTSFLLLGGCASKNKMEIANVGKSYNDNLYKVYSNKTIGVYLQYPFDWNTFDDQEKIKNTDLSFLKMDSKDVFVLLITPSKSIPHKYEFEDLKYPIIAVMAIKLPVNNRELPDNIINEFTNYKISLIEEQESTTYGPTTVNINGKKWITFSAKMNTVNGFVKSYSYIDEEGIWYEISAMCKLDKINEYTHHFDKTIESIEVTQNDLNKLTESISLRSEDVQKTIADKPITKERTYVKIQEPDVVFSYGKIKYTVNVGDTLEVIRAKTCKSGSGKCWIVKHVSSGKIGAVSVRQMRSRHNVYSAKQPEGDSLQSYDNLTIRTYVEIQQPQKIRRGGEIKYIANPGDKLEVLQKTTCRSGYGECWGVRNLETGKFGYVNADRMHSRHRVYTDPEK